MRILYAGALDLGLEKGDTLHFVQLADALINRGHTLAVVAIGKKVNPAFEQFDLHLVPNIKLRKIGVLIRDVLIFAKTIRLMSECKFDLIYQRGIPYLNRQASYQKIPSIVEINGISVNELQIKGGSGVTLIYTQHRERNIIACASRIFTVSEGIKQQLADIYDVDPSICIVEPNAADVDLFKPMDAKKCKQKMGWLTNYFHILFVGTYQSWVDYSSLLKAISILIGRAHKITSWFVGDGILYEQIRQEVMRLNLEDSVELVGRVPHAEVPLWIGASDVCIVPILPNRGEASAGSPLKLFEYMASHRPVVGTDLPGISEHLQNSSAGLLYPPEDAQALANQIERLYLDSDLRERLGRNGHEYVKNYHSWDNVARKVEEIAAELIQNPIYKT